MFKNAFIKYILIESNHKPELSAALLIQQFSVMYFRPVQTSSWLVLWEQTRLGWGELRGVKKKQAHPTKFKHRVNSVQMEQPWQTKANACINHRRVMLWFIYASGFGFGPRERQVWFAGTCSFPRTKKIFCHLTVDHTNDCLKCKRMMKWVKGRSIMKC